MATVWEDKDTKSRGEKKALSLKHQTNTELALQKASQKQLETEPLLDHAELDKDLHYETKVLFQREIGPKEAMFICFFINYIIVRAI